MKTRFLTFLLTSLCLLTIASSEQQLNQNTEQRSATKPISLQTFTLKGEDLEGATFKLLNQQGQSLHLKISNVERDLEDPEQETYLYTILFQNPETSTWENLCLPDLNHVAKAIPLSGTWDETGTHKEDGKITFACTNGVLAKCVRWGYKPWKTVNGESLRDYHQACTRMARADYCGRGMSHTQDGTPIDLYDRLKIQRPDRPNGMVFEAAWTPEGAVLLHHTRYPDMLEQLWRECPEKLQAILQQRPVTEAEVDQRVPNALIFNRSFVKE